VLLGEVREVRVQVRVQGCEAVGVYDRLSWGLSSNLVWRGQQELAHLRGPARVPVAEVLRPPGEAGIGTMRVSDQRYGALWNLQEEPWGCDCQ
jgi:hypothetical protein